MSVIWEFQENMARTAKVPWRLQSEPARPAHGISVWHTAQSPWMLLGVQPMPNHGLHLAEAYARNSDLILRFEQSRTDTFAFQLNYRLLPPPQRVSTDVNYIESDFLGIELWLSVQTDLLDAAPKLTVTSRCPAGQTWVPLSLDDLSSRPTGTSSDASGLGAIVCNTDECTGVWLIDPSDAGQVRFEYQPADEFQRLQLFGDSMEKGVIRRARMRFHLGTGHWTMSQIKALVHEFAQSPLPLTA